MKQKRNYAEEAERLSKAIDIAIDAFTKFIPDGVSEEFRQHMIKCYNEWKSRVLHPEPKYRTLASLKYSIDDVFTYFQESSGPTADYFWKEVNNAQLGYAREDKLRKILDRGKIRGRIEYDFATDAIVAAQQAGRINAEEASRLSGMIGVYESKKKTG